MKRLSWLFYGLISIAILAFLTFTSYSHQYLGKEFKDSDHFQTIVESQMNEVYPTLINRFDVKEEIKNLEVTENEIEEYRMYYGSQMDQIRDVSYQYESLIEQATSLSEEEMMSELVNERDEKIAEIRKNFADDEVVRNKIMEAKKQALEEYDRKVSNSLPHLKALQNQMAYELTNVVTGEHYSFGDVKDANAIKKEYSSKTGFLRLSNVNQNYMNVEDGELRSLSIFYISNMIKDQDSQFSGTVAIPKTTNASEHMQGLTNFNQNKAYFYSLWMLGLIAFGGAIWLFNKRKAEILSSPTQPFIQERKLEIRLLLIFIPLVLAFAFSTIVSDQLSYYEYYYSNLRFAVYAAMMVLLFVFFLTLALIQSVWLFTDSRKTGIRTMWERSIFKKWVTTIEDVFLNRRLGTQIIIILLVVFLAGLGLAGIFVVPELLIIYVPLFVFILMPALYLLLKRVGDYNKLALATEHMAKGHQIADVRIGGKSVFANHAKHLNMLREGVRMSQSEQAKSERLKTELITNVSHDLRTPLTSIITYTDLLKKVDLTDEERLSYVAILDRKSQRLKTLIEDLFEVSKMASGNMELNKQRVDLTQLMQQALAEHEEAIQVAGLDFRVAVPENPIHAFVDGQKWWRMLDNLIVNAIKYTLPGTRVYVTLKEMDGCAQIILKNVTKFELGENVDELFERFKRADTSRHTEGSGLGLAIAQSIVDLHGGSLRINVDGDLFKVTVSIKTDS
ncbi:histidine kinase dimerization/phospho-acceptor domain-containing protein [Paenisporosarcina sp. NPDC076898]|uniref:sensor histidine kinase n=1 Tax=unclassified Paenisporosarcina TaxID=2642018 RepID=UPI003D0263FB